MLTSQHSAFRTKPLVIVSAITGAQYHPSEFPAIPIEPANIAEVAKSVRDLGATFGHIHMRNPSTGYQNASRSGYLTIRDKVRESAPNMLLSFPTSRKGEVESQIAGAQDALQMALGRSLTAGETVDLELLRALGVQASPDTITTFTAPEIRIAGKAGSKDIKAALDSYSSEVAQRWSQPEVMQLYYRRLRQLARQYRVGEEVEITTMGAFDVVEALALEPSLGMSPQVHFVLLFGFSSRLPIRLSTFREAMSRVRTFSERTGIHPGVTVGAVIRPHEAAEVDEGSAGRLSEGTHDYRELFEWALFEDLVSGFRVGLEDTPYLYGNPVTNEFLVRHAVSLCTEAGVRVETEPAAARRILLQV